MRALAIAWVDTKRFLRDRSNVFFVFVFPLLIVLLIGVQFGSATDVRVGVHVADEGGPAVDRLVGALGDVEDFVVEHFGDEAAMVEAVQRGTVQGGLVVPAGYDEALRGDGVVDLVYVGSADQSSLLVGQTVRSVVSSEAIPVRAARFTAAEGVASYDEALGVARAIAERPTVTVQTRDAGESAFSEFQGLGAFDLGAHTQLVLFVFVTSLAGSAALIQTRTLGVGRRMVSTPTSVASILGGLTLGRLGVALTQGLYIILGTLIVFGVEWGDPLGAAAVLLAFSLVGAAAGMFAGALFSNDQQAGGIGVLVGLGLAALGGAMVPIEIFPDTLATIAKATPHAWAIDGFAELVRRDGTIVDVLPHLGVLAAFATVLLGLGVWRLRYVLTR